MKSVCSNCQSSTHTNNFFTRGDQAVRLYNEGYYEHATKMLNELTQKGLLKDNPWTDELQITGICCLCSNNHLTPFAKRAEPVGAGK